MSLQTQTEKTDRKPEWLKIRPPSGEKYKNIKSMLRELDLYTVCEEARCPNINECWAGGTATFMLLGDTCTRGCRFCAVKTGNPRGVVDKDEPVKVAGAIKKLALDYVVITSVDRDDLEDGGSGHFAETIRNIKSGEKHIITEVLISDFRGDWNALKNITDAQPEVVAHNIETVERLSPRVRDKRAGYIQSLNLLAKTKELDSEILTKSSIMLGLGETEEEIIKSMQDLRDRDVDILTLGQYLRPSKKHLPVIEFITPEKFDYYAKLGEEMGFIYVASGPLVRSSFKAADYFKINNIVTEKKKNIV